MPFKSKFSGKARYIKDREAISLIEDQAKHIYKRVQTEDVVNVDTIKQELEPDKIDKMDDANGKINPYHEIITNKVERDNIIVSHIEQW